MAGRFVSEVQFNKLGTGDEPVNNDREMSSRKKAEEVSRSPSKLTANKSNLKSMLF